MGIFITVLIAVALLSFIIDPTTLQSALNMFSSKNDVGRMDGKGISYQEYAKKIQYFTNIQQLVAGTTSLNEQSTEIVNNSAWQECLYQYVLQPAIDKAGVKIGKEEMLDLTQGKEISPLLQRETIFRDRQTGVFDREKFMAFVNEIAKDPDGVYAQYWDFLEKNMRQEQIINKYASLLIKSLITNPIELRRNIEENNQTARVDFVLSPLGFARDTTITVSRQEVSDYYRAHRTQFEQEAGRDIEYVVFNIVPSLEDIEDAEKEAEKYYPEFCTTSNLKQFLARNSDRGFDRNYYKKGELLSVSAALDSFAFAAKIGDILPVYKDNITFRAARLLDIKKLPDSVLVKHILIQRGTREEEMRVRDSLMTELKKGADFSALAMAFSADETRNDEPGLLGWLTRQYMFPGLDTCLSLPTNKYVALETQYGSHIIKVTQRTRLHRKVQLAVMEKQALPGKETMQAFYADANSLSSQATNNQEFNDLAREKHWSPIPAVGLKENAKTIPGYENTREIIRWAFDKKAKTGSVSPVIAVENKYFFVASLTGLHEKGVATLTEKYTEIVDLLTAEKRMDKLMAGVKENLQGADDINAYAEKAGLTVSNKSGIAFGAQGSQQLDSKFIGAVAGAPLHQLVGPVRGDIGVYVFQVQDRETGSFYTEADARNQMNRMGNIQGRMILTVLAEAADVEDNRAKFF